MSESKVNSRNYITIAGWMVSELKLKGNELMLYAIIYGFSQADDQMFSGSLQYLADWTNSTKQGVIKSLKTLCEKGYISKREEFKNGVKFCHYYATKFNGVLNFVEQGIEQSLMGGIKQSLPNNIDKDIIENNIGIKDSVHDVIAYLNEKAGTKYRDSTPKTVTLLTRLLTGKNPFTVDDCKRVIDNKCSEWKGTEWEKFLRPETLFGNKFESYLNQRPKQQRRSSVGYSEQYI